MPLPFQILSAKGIYHLNRFAFKTIDPKLATDQVFLMEYIVISKNQVLHVL